MSATPAERVAALDRALTAGEGRLPREVVDAGRAVVARAGERAALSAEHTVVALAGATGSGKSSLLNALAGEEVARTGVQRPTTSEALAVVRGPGAGPLLDWLGVRRRHELAGGRPRRGAGLVLLDLPDHDSVVAEHRLRAEHLVDRVDLLVWVVDPQKYADAALHERYLRPLARHADVLVLALNQADRLSAAEVDAVLADLRRLTALDGPAGARVLAVSARTGLGLDRLGALLDEAAERREAATRRLTADVEVVALRVLEACGDATGSARQRLLPSRGTPTASGRTDRAAPPPDLVAALADAAGVPVVVEATRRSAVRRATAAAGWPPVRWLQRLRPDPLRRLHLGAGSAGAGSAGPGSAGPGAAGAGAAAPTGRTSLPAPGPATRAAAATAVRRSLDAATAGVPDAWALAVRSSVGDPDLADPLDVAVSSTPLLPDRVPWWARATNVVQTVLLAAAAAGALWLGVLAGLAYLRLPEPRTPQWGPLPVPTALLGGGLLVGIALALLAGALARLMARRRARAVRARLLGAVAEVARDRVTGPAAAVLDDLDACRTQARVAAGRSR
ncbi:GTPase family protein [Cellulomonas sp. C5510]|uniref:GTPase family protein n=1 Tax=Cellulomonas sp. C5510 TaxID=2871170 RepID=UPI001C983B38|nr:GTPase [Cellulomonas sp. C5510]QZN86740.1 50S ribosome-binding GTPase [Cellulomonas sp. C5510]